LRLQGPVRPRASARTGPLDGVPPTVIRRAAAVRLLVLDFDGVLTDNTVTVRSDGAESVTCWRGDGLGLSALQDVGVGVHVLSTETDPVVGVRCRKLGVPHEQGLADKAAALRRLGVEQAVDLQDIAYIGNDVNDLGCLVIVGLPVVVGDAHPDTHPVAAHVTMLPGGRGAVRELCDLILAARDAEGSR
jgi:3-deoxy-D-manno-octulosonate 8-phosphate phosphatase (KDO 8-P phosphatase)